MRTAKTMSMAEDVVRLHQALSASLKGVRALAERVKKEATEGQVKAQMDSIISRSVLGQNALQPKPKKERPAEGERRLSKVGRLLATLSENQLQLVMGLARSLARDVSKGGRPPKGPSPSSENHLPSAGGDPATSHTHTVKGKD